MIEAILNYQFMQNAILSGMMIGFIAPLIGVFLVVRRLSLIADALSHITLSGVAAGLFFGQLFPYVKAVSPVYFGLLFSLIGSFFMDQLRQIYKHYQEIAIPIILAAGTGLGVVLISLANGFNTDLFGYLFGSLLSVSREDVYHVFGAGIVVGLVVLLLYKELLYVTFDEEAAKIAGLPIRLINTLFSILVALVVAMSMQIVGILLVSALISIPAAAALQLANSFRQAILYAIVFGEASVTIGLIVSYYLNLASGGTIVLLAVLFLCIVLITKRVRMIRFLTPQTNWSDKHDC